MIIYVDFDGILVDTWPTIEKNYRNIYYSDTIEEMKLRQMFQELDWKEVLYTSKKNKENIDIIRDNTKYKLKILTKINSENEKENKIKFLKKYGVGAEIITLYIDESKSTIVNPVGNVLIDDELKNIEEWEEKGGKGILYSKNDNNKDSDGKPNTKYKEISSLKQMFDNICIDNETIT